MFINRDVEKDVSTGRTLPFCQCVDSLNEITLVLEGKHKWKIKADSRESIIVNSVFGQYYVYLLDRKHSLALKMHEWYLLVNNIPLVPRLLLEIFYLEDLIQIFIDQVLSYIENSCTELLHPKVTDRLYGELSLYKRRPYGGCG